MSDGQFPAETSEAGEYVRQDSAFRRRVTRDGGSGIPATAGRHHLYVSLACPWAHRTVIFRKLHRLEDVLGMTVVDPIRDDRGWAFTSEPGCEPDPVNGFRFLSEAYAATDPAFSGRVSVPVLWDKQAGAIVNNESAEIIRMLNSEFGEPWDGRPDFYPSDLRGEIDELNGRIYRDVNNGVYRAGFATSQQAYDRAVDRLFETLAELDERLSSRRYLCGDRPTEADWRLFTTLVRFDVVYVGHFKCNVRRLVDYPSLWPYLRDLYQHPGVAETVSIDHVKRHYHVTHASINPHRIVPRGPVLDFDEPHGREALG